MLANLNFTWKGPCIEVLNHLSTFTHSTDPVCTGLTFAQFAERKPGSLVAELGLPSGPGRRAIVQIVSRCVVKPRKRRTTFLKVSGGGRIIPRIWSAKCPSIANCSRSSLPPTTSSTGYTILMVTYGYTVQEGRNSFANWQRKLWPWLRCLQHMARSWWTLSLPVRLGSNTFRRERMLT